MSERSTSSTEKGKKIQVHEDGELVYDSQGRLCLSFRAAVIHRKGAKNDRVRDRGHRDY